MPLPDTLTADTTLLASWARTGDYDYASQLQAPEEPGFWDLLMRALDRWLGTRDVDFGHWDALDIILTVCGVVLLLVALWLWARYAWNGRRGLSLGFGRHRVAYEVSDDNIFQPDLEGRLRRAVAAEDYDEALRLTYLLRLRTLSERGLIDWQRQLTPATYVAQLPEGPERESLRRLTADYVRMRYGHYPADPARVRAWLGEKGGGR